MRKKRNRQKQQQRQSIFALFVRLIFVAAVLYCRLFWKETICYSLFELTDICIDSIMATVHILITRFSRSHSICTKKIFHDLFVHVQLIQYIFGRLTYVIYLFALSIHSL